MVEEGNIHKTLLYATADPECEIILICGSFFLMREAKGFFQPDLLEVEVDESISECVKLKQNISYS